MKKWYNVLLAIVNSILYLVVVALWISIPDELTLNLAVSALTMGLSLVLIFLNRDTFSVYYQSHQFKKLQETIVFFALLFCFFMFRANNFNIVKSNRTSHYRSNRFMKRFYNMQL